MPDRPEEDRIPCQELRDLLGVLKLGYGLTGTDVAGILGVPDMKISRWKTGRTDAPPEFRVFCRYLLNEHKAGRNIAKGLRNASTKI